MDQINVIIIDDEESARENLKYKIDQYSKHFYIQGEAENIIQAKSLIDKFQPDVIFLDISMPQGSGFDLLNEFPQINFKVVFVTAYNRFAIQAFKYFAIGYLLKPIETSELHSVLDHVLSNNNIDHSQNIKHFLEHNNKEDSSPILAVPVETGFEFIDVKEIIYFEADKGYSNIFMENSKRIISAKPLSYYYNLLDPNFFIQVHRSFIINLPHLRKYHKIGFVKMSDGKEIPIAKTKRSEFKNMFR